MGIEADERRVEQSTMNGFDENPPAHSKVVVIGSGPAGHTASIYLARANLNPIMFEVRPDCDAVPPAAG